MIKTFIERPVLSTVISLIIVVLGIIGIYTLPVEQYPNIAPPTVQVTATYSGADASVIMNSVIIPLEEAINGVEGMTYITSSGSNSGQATITVFFKQGVDGDIAAVNVQNRVSKVTPLLPQEVTQIGVVVQKQQVSTVMMMAISSDNDAYNSQFIQNYANINILPQIKRVSGVGDATVYGAKDYSMRIWLKPDQMTTYKINPKEVIEALQDQNIEAAPGQLGQDGGQAFQYTMKYTGRLKSVEEFENITVRSQNGQLLKVKDVATVELGALSYVVNSQIDGRESIVLAISQTAGSNAQELINNIKITIDDAKKTFPPGMKVTYMMDTNEFLSASIEKVIHTLLEAFLLVFIVVFVFLQNIRSTLIPALAVPVAIIGTFFFLQIFGFSINLLTLFALILAIGIVVDDAIVVVEAVHAQMDSGERDPRTATINAMKEITPAIISITLVMASVFIPVSFIGGTTGVFYKQFGLTLAIAIVISAVNALTLSPALCALLLKPHQEGAPKKKRYLINRFYDAFNRVFEAATEKYRSSLLYLGKKGHRWITVLIIAVSTLIMVVLNAKIPTGFVPQEDSGAIMGFVTLPPGASLERTDSIVKQTLAMANEIEGVTHTMSLSGTNFMSGMGSSYGSMIFKMKPWNERKLSTSQFSKIMTEKTKDIKDGTFIFFGTPTLQGFGLTPGVELKLQDKMGGDIHKFYDVSSDFLAAMNKRKEVMVAMTNFNPNFPQKQVVANVPKIKEAGLKLKEVMEVMQAYVGSMYVSNFNLYGKQFRVMVQSSPEFRAKLQDLSGLSIKTASGEMAPITEFLTITDVSGPQSLSRFNLYSSIDVTIIPNFMEGYSTGDIIKIMDEVQSTTLPSGYGYDYSGMSREEAAGGSQTILIFGLCLIFVYLLLAALYESYIIPLGVLFSLPVGLAGVYIFLLIFGLSFGIVNNIYVQISMIMLIGLLSKNAILIFEYAVQRRKAGMSIVNAAVNGAVARLRPILMTSFAFICGLLPLMFASGAGAIGNRSIGISAVGGMFIGTMIGILVIPSLFIIFQNIQEKISKSGFINSTEN